MPKFEREEKYYHRKLRPGCLLNIQEDMLPTLQTWVQIQRGCRMSEYIEYQRFDLNNWNWFMTYSSCAT